MVLLYIYIERDIYIDRGYTNGSIFPRVFMSRGREK
jgi:hypothetical protein